MSTLDPAEGQEVIAPGAFDGVLPATVPVRRDFEGPAIGEATITQDENGLTGQIQLDDAGVWKALTRSRPLSVSFRIPVKPGWMQETSGKNIQARWAPGTRPEGDGDAE